MSGAFATHTSVKYYSYVMLCCNLCMSAQLWTFRETLHFEKVCCFIVHITFPMQKEPLRQRGGVLGSAEGNGKTKGGAEL